MTLVNKVLKLDANEWLKCVTRGEENKSAYSF